MDPLDELMNGYFKEYLKIIPDGVKWGDQSGDVFNMMRGDFMKPVIDIGEIYFTIDCHFDIVDACIKFVSIVWMCVGGCLLYWFCLCESKLCDEILNFSLPFQRVA